MEVPKLEDKSSDVSITKDSKVIQCLSTNWRLSHDNKRLSDAVSTVTASKAPGRLTLEDIVTDDSYVTLQPLNANVDDQRETCIIDINLTKGQKISRIAVVSEASVLEFFKESGEYADTAFAELIDEYDDATVYLVELAFQRPISQCSIKFTRIHNLRSNMYLYGIKLVLEECQPSPSGRHAFQDILTNSFGQNIATGTKLPMGLPDFSNMPDYDGNFATEMDACLRSFMGKAWNREKPKKDVTAVKVEEIKKEENTRKEGRRDESIEMYIDEKLRDMEKRLVQRIDEAEARNSEKLDAILKHLEMKSSS